MPIRDFNSLSLGVEPSQGKNIRTGESMPFPTTWEEAEDFIPQHVLFKMILKKCKDRGDSINLAVLYTLDYALEGEKIADENYIENKYKWE